IVLTNAHQRLPALDNFVAELQLDQQVANLTDCQLLVQGQPVTLTGQMPLGEDFWSKLKHKQLPGWEKATARLRIENAEVAAFADLVPAFVAPQGQVQVDLSLTPGGKVAGGLVLNGARTRPLPGIGPIRDIEARLKFEER